MLFLEREDDVINAKSAYTHTHTSADAYFTVSYRSALAPSFEQVFQTNPLDLEEASVGTGNN